MATRSWRPTKRARAFAPGICVLAGCCEVVYVLGVAGVPREVSLGVPGVRRRRRVVDQADRTISTGKLHVLPRFHTRPIDVVDRKSVVEGKSVSVRVAFGGRRSIKQKTNKSKK